MRKALAVGINYYESIPPLHGCVKDAHAVKAALDRNADGTRNFGVQLLTGTGPDDLVKRKTLRDSITELFAEKNEIALLFFAGHGYVDNVGGYLVASDTENGDDGVPLAEVIQLANDSPAQNRIIILDSCHSGMAGNRSTKDTHAILNSGVTILTASSETQYAMEQNGSGLFTSLLVDALNGSASDLVGHVTPGSVYAHIDQSLGVWEQRPFFKTNVDRFCSLRKVAAPIELGTLRKLCDYFQKPYEDLALDPSFEPTSEKADPRNTEIFADLQDMVKVNLVRPFGEDHMYYAAMHSKSCKLTLLGEHYWKLVKKDQI